MFLVRALFVWFVMLGVMFCNGALRMIFLSPLVGDSLARNLAVFTGSALILFVACLFILWIHAKSTASLLAVGFLWLFLTAGFELGFGHYILEMPWEAVLAEFNVLEGRLFSLALVLLTFSPMIAARLRERFKLR